MNMKKLLHVFAALGALVAVSCQQVDTDLAKRVENLEGRVAALESQVTAVQSSIEALQTLIGALKADLTVASVTPKDGGFVIKFSDGTSYTIEDGVDGVDGKDAPVVGVKQDTDGQWYWTLDGEWLLNDGAKVAARGADGTDGVTPQLKVEDGWWLVTYDGSEWVRLVEADASASTPSITVTEDEDNVYFTQSDGTVITIAKISSFAFFVDTPEVVVLSAEPFEVPYIVTKADETVKLDVLECTGGYQAEIVASEPGAGVIRITPPETVVEGSVLLSAVKNSTGEIRMQTIAFKSGDEPVTPPEPVEINLVWDFSQPEWQEVFAPLGEPNTNYENWDFTVNGLRYFATGSSRWNTTFIQTGGAGNLNNRVFSFTAPAEGKLKVTVSNTGGSEDLSRLVAVCVDGGEPQTLPGGSPSTDAPTVCEFDVTAGLISIYSTGALRFYKIEFTYMGIPEGDEPGPGPEPEPQEVTCLWDFTASYSADINVADSQNYVYNADGTATAVTEYAENTLYLSPNGKAIKSNNKTCTADGLAYHPLSYGGGAAYMFIRTSKPGKLVVSATIGKDPSNAENCKLGIKIDGVLQEETQVDLEAYNLDVAGCAAKSYEWDIANETGAVQEIQIVKPSGTNSPWLFSVSYTYVE